jgi:hypothetical protein
MAALPKPPEPEPATDPASDDGLPPPTAMVSGGGSSSEAASPGRVSRCGRCHGTFSRHVADRAYLRPQGANCVSCGAAAHWEGPWGPAIDRFQQPKEPEKSQGGQPWIGMGYWGRHTLSGRWINANSIPAGSNVTVSSIGREPSHGRKRESGWDEETGAPRDAWKNLGETLDLSGGGWIVEEAGSTGLPVGRPVEGLRGAHLNNALNEVYNDNEYFFFVLELARLPDGTIPTDDTGVKLNRNQLRAVREEVVKRVPNANTESLTDHLGMSKSALYKIKRAVGTLNSPKGGGPDTGDAGHWALRSFVRVEPPEWAPSNTPFFRPPRRETHS